MTGCYPNRIGIHNALGPGSKVGINETETTIAEMLKSIGYKTAIYGKWHLGDSPKFLPTRHGFDEFYGWKSQGIAHTYYPTTVVYNGKELPQKPDTFVHDQIMDRARLFIRTQAESKTPFFCYIPTAVPHAAMHAPKELHEKWRKVFPQFDNKVGKYGARGEPCPDVKNPIAGFAAMLENLDNEVGEILALLKKLDIDDNTLVMFTSDNGAHKEGGHDPTFWNSTGSLRGHKRDMHEGGIRTPMLARWPGVIEPGTKTGHLSGFQDVLPTVCDLIDQPVPTQNDGISFLPTLRGEANQKSHEYLYFEFCKGNDQKIFSQAVRKGPWKAYREVKKATEIFNLNEDPYEKNNLAESMPEKVKQMETIMQAAHMPLAAE